MRVPLANASSPPSTDVSPASIRSSVVLPEPLRPDSVIRSRRSSRNETPRRSGSPTLSLARSEAMTTAMRSGYFGLYNRRDAPRSPHAAPDRLPARADRAGRARGRGARRRRGPLRGDVGQGRHQRGLHHHRRVPVPHLPAEHDHVGAGQAQGRPQAGRQGAPRARRPAWRLVARSGTSAPAPPPSSPSTGRSGATPSTARPRR